MRETKFRAWNKLKKIMVYEDEDNSSVYLDGWCASDVQVLNQTLNSKFVKDIYEFMQYTGLKDKNGKEIYEGDIVKFKMYDGEYENYKIVFRNAEFEAINEDDTNFISTDIWNVYGEVIGNIYDNPELLKKK